MKRMKKRFFAFVAIIAWSIIPCRLCGQVPDFPQMRASQLSDAFRDGRIEPLRPFLADSCAVEGYRGTMGIKVLQAVVMQLRKVEAVRVVDVRPTADEGCEVTVELQGPESVRTGSFALDREGRFTRFSLAGRVQAVSAALRLLDSVPFCELPFENVNGFIVLRDISVDGRSGTFVLDSGCQRLLFNSASRTVAAATVASGTTERRGVVSSGARSVSVVKVDSLAVGDNLFSATAPASDLTALADKIGLEELTGLIGADLLRHFETHIDYARGTVGFYALDEAGNPAGAPSPKGRFGFDSVRGYLPCFDAAAGNIRLRMCFDTGAQRCCLTPEAVGRLGSRFRRKGNVALSDADATREAVSGRIGRLTWCGMKRRNADVVVQDLARLGDMDGIVGYPMVAGRHISLNYVRRELAVY